MRHIVLNDNQTKAYVSDMYHRLVYEVLEEEKLSVFLEYGHVCKMIKDNNNIKRFKFIFDDGEICYTAGVTQKDAENTAKKQRKVICDALNDSDKGLMKIEPLEIPILIGMAETPKIGAEIPIPEISKNGRTEEVTKRFFAENMESMDIRGLEKSSCEKDGFISDAECMKQIDGQLVKKSGKCGNTEISFSVPVLDPVTNLVFVYKFMYCGVLCASSDLVVYELKSNGELEMKYWLGLISS